MQEAHRRIAVSLKFMLNYKHASTLGIVMCSIQLNNLYAAVSVEYQ